ncbi:MAG: ABC transporter permease [Pseudodesulfovibrio sp.]
MNSRSILSLFCAFYILAFLAYMLLPLCIMGAAAFNTATIPTVSPWKGFTLEWFSVLFADGILGSAIFNSFVIALGVIALSIPLGLAGALLLTQMRSRARSLLYAVMISPILTPGVIVGISTLIFWGKLGLSGGMVLTILGQTTFIASFCMLLFLARLQRFDRSLEEAALDLGASHRQVFFQVTLPFLRPTMLTAACIAFLQSFENYNTTLFVIGAKNTMTLRIAGMVRLGLTPEINALAVIFICLTVAAALAYELRRRAEKHRAASLREAARREDAAIAGERTETAVVQARHLAA